jgi:hypothetical protein
MEMSTLILTILFIIFRIFLIKTVPDLFMDFKKDCFIINYLLITILKHGFGN